MDHIAGIVDRRPGAACAGEVGTMRERLELAAVRGEPAGALQLGANGLVDLLTAPVVRGDDDGIFRLGGIVLGDGRDTIYAVLYLGHAALLGQQLDALLCLSGGKVLDRFQQLRILLAHDLVQLRGLHPGLLHLLEGLAGLHALMLADVTDDQDPVLGRDLLKEIPHLLRRSERGFVEHIKVALTRRILGFAGEEAL